MDKHLEMRYNLATRFDESDLALSVRYKDTMHKLLSCMDQIALLDGARVPPWEDEGAGFSTNGNE